MALNVQSEVLIYVCCSCIPEAGRLARQWMQDGLRVRTQEVPCSGKTDAQYLFHALEGGAQGLCIVACPKGECRLAQGNYRAEVRVRTVQRLLEEIGLEPERIELLHFAPGGTIEDLEQTIRGAVERFAQLASNPVGAQAG